MKHLVNGLKSSINRRSFMKNGLTAAGAATVGAGLLSHSSSVLGQEGPEEHSGRLTKGDAAILRFLAAAEILETDFWVQYNELGGIQDSEVPGGSGIPAYTAALKVLDGDMDQYIHDNTEDEFTHQNFINAYLTSKGADTVNLDQFRTLPGSSATGSSGKLRLTNLTQLTLDTSWWTRYRSRTKNPDFGDTFPPAIPTLAVGQHTAIPRTDDDVKDPNFLQAIANTAAFHFPTIEQGGNSLYPSLAQRVTNVEVLRVVLSIGPTETAHFQTWHDKAGNAPPLTAVDPVTSVSVTFPDLNSPPFGGEDFQTNLIMPEPCPFLSRKLPVCSKPIAFLVAYGELAIGIALVLGILVRPASICGVIYMLSLLFSANYPGPHAAFWQYFGASLEHLVLALCFAAFASTKPQEIFSIRTYLGSPRSV